MQSIRLGYFLFCSSPGVVTILAP